ncbi:hypothetical protein [Pedobacter frigoris]|uniref:Uncharacterized protein n=1 Tax=Pedobacter frigoris TaxID=2571272 RepID=A0A4U1CQH3_9SPHI|nr:hypothetical protein [Pedobacter frigoris]TKC09075.1 hypothetical protein FA047_02985 [Pedobacter frigoris]
MENLFKSIIGEQLSSVEFVQDYLQLHFDGNTLTFYSWPEVNLESINYKIGDIMYRDALCKIIASEVNNVVLLENTRLELFFTNDSSISLSLVRDQSNSSLAEFLYFVDVNEKWFVLD